MAAPLSTENCRVCSEQLPKKSRRSIFNQFFSVFEQLCEVMGHIPHVCDGESPYVCSGCFNKLNKIELDLTNKVTELRNQKLNLLGELRNKYLKSLASSSTPKKSSKRVIQHTHTPRKVKIRPVGETENVTVRETENAEIPAVNQHTQVDATQLKSRKKLVLTENNSNVQKEFTPGKVKVSFFCALVSQCDPCLFDL